MLGAWGVLAAPRLGTALLSSGHTYFHEEGGSRTRYGPFEAPKLTSVYNAGSSAGLFVDGERSLQLDAVVRCVRRLRKR